MLEAFIYGLEAFGAVKAEDYRQDLTQCFALLADTPRLGRKADIAAPSARRHEHGRHVIFYEEQPYGVLILAVIHERSIRGLRTEHD